jgi:hypothetical protein
MKGDAPPSIETVDLDDDAESIQSEEASENNNSLSGLKISDLRDGELLPYTHPDLTISPNKGTVKPGEEVSFSLDFCPSGENSKLHAALYVNATGKIFKGDIFGMTGNPTIELQSVQKVVSVHIDS